ncbi:Os11g0218560 [Oryza sativa Japonica Group]|uniref:Os11g0218560 protein n=1 Tax=Oryza sativa subsp. japonica TaxID=39947 RepID=A0A0P0Y081_ORYSJ|nr:Os11g0218560 [Oryza sativa Japonica Group]
MALLKMRPFRCFQINIKKRRLITHANAESKSERFPPPHQDGAVSSVPSYHKDPLYEPQDLSSFSTVFTQDKSCLIKRKY